jgi:hypothetical protein
VFTQPETRQGPHRMTKPFRVIEFQPLEPNVAFEAMTLEDARWMARLIAQLTEKQIREALRVSGFNAEAVNVLSEKLLNRRSRMLHDLQLSPIADHNAE